MKVIAKYSILKLFLVDLFSIIVFFAIQTPGFSNGLVYTAFLFEPKFFILKILVISAEGLMAIYGLVLLIRALIGIPMICMDGAFIYISRSRTVKIPISKIESVMSDGNKNIVIKIKNGRDVVVAMALSIDYSGALERMKSIIQNH